MTDTPPPKARPVVGVERQRATKSEIKAEEVFSAIRRDLAERRGEGYPDHAVELSFAERLRFLWKKSRLTADELSEALGVSPSSFKGWIGSGGPSPNLKNLLRIQEVTGISIQWLATGQGPMVIGTATARSSGAGFSNFLYVPKFDVRTGCHTGRLAGTETLKVWIAFREEWLRTLLRDPATVVVLEAFGDSMSPTIKHGDILLADTAETAVHGCALYALWAGNKAVIRRVELTLEGAVIVKSDNTAYEDRKLLKSGTEDLRLIGKVIWHGGKVT